MTTPVGSGHPPPQYTQEPQGSNGLVVDQQITIPPHKPDIQNWLKGGGLPTLNCLEKWSYSGFSRIHTHWVNVLDYDMGPSDLSLMDLTLGTRTRFESLF